MARSRDGGDEGVGGRASGVAERAKMKGRGKGEKWRRESAAETGDRTMHA